MTLAELQTRVKIKVDEYTPAGVSHSFDDYLTPMLQESADELSESAPKWLFTPENIPTTSIVYSQDDTLETVDATENNWAYIPVPSDFARLYDIKFPLWERPVYEMISIQDPRVRVHDNEFVEAGYGRPVVIFRPYDIPTDSPDAGIAKYLQCGKVVTGALPLYARYIKYMTLSPSGDSGWPSTMEEALTWLAASKLLQILEYPNQSVAAQERYLRDLSSKMR